MSYGETEASGDRQYCDPDRCAMRRYLLTHGVVEGDLIIMCIPSRSTRGLNNQNGCPYASMLKYRDIVRRLENAQTAATKGYIGDLTKVDPTSPT